METTVYLSPETLNEVISALDPFQQDHSQDFERAGWETSMERDLR